MSVVQRCPSCGTTSPAAGECEACHEAQVRYFCTNHTPGLWLDEPTCARCGARFGEPDRARASSAPHAPASSSTPVSPSRRAKLTDVSDGAWDTRVRRAPEEDDDVASLTSRLAPWQKLLLSAVRARYAPARASRTRAPMERPVRGCLVRLVLLLVLVLVALAGALFLFGQALLQNV